MFDDTVGIGSCTVTNKIAIAKENLKIYLCSRGY
jgi:hypothetical protein